MENKQFEASGSKKPRVSKGKLKKSANRKSKRLSQGFSSSFTRKTLNNNTLLAQSLAKEKSRNEKFLVLHQELMTSRNEALMRLNETEASFDRLGALVQRGIRQMQEVASTMGDVFAEIRTSKNNPRDSASMRSSWNDTVSTTGRTIMKQPVLHMNGMQENIAENDQSPRCMLLSPSLPVSPIEEELESTCSDDDDDTREDSLVSRRTPTPRQAANGGGGRGATARLPRRVQRGMARLPGHDFGLSPPWAETGDAHDRTSLSLVDMDETVGGGVSAQDSFHTASGGERPEEGSPGEVSYEDMFCATPAGDGGRSSTHARSFAASRGEPAGTDSPDFLGFSNDTVTWATHGGNAKAMHEESLVAPTPDHFAFLTVESSSNTKPRDATCLPRLTGAPSDDDEAADKSPGLSRKQSKLSGAGRPNSKVKVPSTGRSPSGDVSDPRSSRRAAHNSEQSPPKPTKHSDPDSVVADAAWSPILTGNGDVSAKLHDWDLAAVKTLPMKTSTLPVRLAPLVEGMAARAPERAQAPTPVPPESAPDKSGGEGVDPPSPTTDRGKGGRPRRGCHLDTPERSTAPNETRSADDRPRSTARPTPRPTARSAEVPTAGRDVGLPPRCLRSWKGAKRESPSTADDATPSRGPKAKTPKVVALVDSLEDDSQCSRASLASEQDASERRTRRRIAQANYKEPPLNTKIRRPVLKHHV